jgi:hypothetical protein
MGRSCNRDDIADLIQHHSPQSTPDGLPLRAKRCLAAVGIPLERQAVLHALRAGTISWLTTRCGKYTHREVCRWLSIAEFFPSPVGGELPHRRFRELLG